MDRVVRDSHGGRHRSWVGASQWLAVLLAGSILTAGDAADAAGFWNLERGPSNYGRGGANTADPEGPIAVFTNPAALAGQRGLQLNIDANMGFDNRTFARASDTIGGRDNVYEPVTNSRIPLPPSIGMFAAYNLASLGLEGLGIGIGVYGPPQSDTVFPANEVDPRELNPISLGSGTWYGLGRSTCLGPRPCVAGQRYSAIETHNLQIHYALAVAYELPWYQIRLGINFMLIDQIIDTKLKLNAPLLPTDAGKPGYDVLVQADAKAAGVPAAILALSGAPFEWLILSAVLQLPYSANAKGIAQLELGEDLASFATIEGDGGSCAGEASQCVIRVRLWMPPVLRLAAKYDDPSGLFDVEVALVWEGWSANQKIWFTPKRVVAVSVAPDPIPVNRVVLNNNWHDTFSVRVGGELNIVEDLVTARAGGYFEQAAVPTERLNAGSFDLDKVGFAIGSRIDLPLGFWFDAAFGVTYSLPKTVTNTEIVLDNPLLDEAAAATYQGPPIANGDYTNTQIWLQAGIGAQIDI